ncbi:hypothetical protein AAF712_003422 [Marasmius tenuissimus]|uniref:Uncharacterized protein n=1 Tax=Marasmius tenuissimus TaxID=585030 RepID=A0ABR3A7Q4_9AGAR
MELPRCDTIVVFNIDAVATFKHLEDPELIEACRKLTCKKYVGMVGMVRATLSLVVCLELTKFSESLQRGQPGFLPKRPYHTYSFKPIYQGLRTKDEEKCIDPEMSVPVLPNTHHPLSRQPLAPSIPLPWQDCYVSHLFGGVARCPTTMLKEKPAHVCELESTNAFQSTLLMDEDRRNQQTRLNTAQKAQYVGMEDPMDDDSAESGYYDSEDEEDDPELEGAPLFNIDIIH